MAKVKKASNTEETQDFRRMEVSQVDFEWKNIKWPQTKEIRDIFTFFIFSIDGLKRPGGYRISFFHMQIFRGVWCIKLGIRWSMCLGIFTLEEAEKELEEFSKKW